MEHTTDRKNDRDANRDPITKAPGSHPVGTGIGSAGTAAVGAAVGTAVAGPVGTLVGGAVGAVAGGLAGHAAGEAVNPTAEEAYWRENYRSRPYYKADRNYDYYAPAYRTGWEARGRYQGQKWDQVESKLEMEWSDSPHGKTMAWPDAKEAARDAWHRVERKLPGDADGDGR